MNKALDVLDNLIPASKAQAGSNYYCPKCKQEVWFKSFKGGRKKAHFAHVSSNRSCPLYGSTFHQREIDPIQVPLEAPKDPLAGIISKSNELAEEIKKLWWLSDKQTEKLATIMRLNAMEVANRIKCEAFLKEQ